MWGSIVGALLKSVAPKVADYYIQKQELENQRELEKLKGKIAWEQALTARASESEGRDHEWELAQIRNSGLKDEWVLGLISIPLILVFIPQCQQYVLSGFDVLSQTPVWYQGMIVTIFLAIYGVRQWRRKTAVDTVLERGDKE